MPQRAGRARERALGAGDAGDGAPRQQLINNHPAGRRSTAGPVELPEEGTARRPAPAGDIILVFFSQRKEFEPALFTEFTRHELS